MKCITLISDWNIREPYVAMFKGQLYSFIQDATIIDFTHAIELLNRNQTAFLLQNGYSSFPSGTVHVILTGATAALKKDPVVVKYDGHFFVGDDNGIFSLLFPESNEPSPGARRYHGEETDFLTKICRLCKHCLDGDWESCTVEHQIVKAMIPLMAIRSGDEIVGKAIYVDAYHNIITNIPVEMFKEATKDKTFSSMVGDMLITQYADTYTETAAEPYFIPNSLGVMEITSYQSRIAILAKWEIDKDIKIKCKSKDESVQG